MSTVAQDQHRARPTSVIVLDSDSPSGKKTVWQAFRSFIWDSDTHLKSAAERRMLFKLDLAMLPCLCLGFFCKYLDQNNISSAYVSGMREDLGWFGNQYTYAVSLYTAAYAIMQIPSTVIVQYVKPSWWLAFCEVGWGCLTIAQAGAKTTEAMYGLRFAIGILESAFFPVGLFLLGSWYTPTELAKRTAIFHFTAPAGTAFGGYLQAAIYTTMNGHLGWPGWRWLYVFCGIITVPCGLLVIFVLPNYPTAESGKPWFLTQEEFELAQERMRRVNRVQTGKVFKLVHLKRIFSGWHVYVLPLTYILYGLACQATSYFNIFLKSTGEYSIVQVNIYPTFLSVIQIVTVPLWGFLSDYHGDRFTWSFGPTVFSIISGAILAAWPNNNRLIMAGFYLGGCQFVTAIIYSWWNEICHKDPMERALAIGMSNGLQYAMSAWLPIVIFPQVEAPSFRKGFPTTLAFTILAAIMLVLVKYLWAREKRLSHSGDAESGHTRNSEEDDNEKHGEKGEDEVKGEAGAGGAVPLSIGGGNVPESVLPGAVGVTPARV